MEKDLLHSIPYRKPCSYLVFVQTFSKWYRFLQKSQWWNNERIKEYQSKKLNELIKHAYSNVPYYKKLFTINAVRPSDIIEISDLQKIPLLNRETIRHHISTLKATNYPSVAFQRKVTGGTTGTPFEFYVEYARWMGIHFAFNRIYMERAGYRWFDKTVSFTGCTKKSMHYTFLRTLEFSSFHMSQEDLYDYYKKIVSFKPTYITAYPSAMTLFTEYLNRTDKRLPKPIKAVFLHGEVLLEHQRKFLENTYDCPVFDQYGHSEQCTLATTCLQSNQYHVFPEYGIIEILDAKGCQVTKEGDQGEIIATSLLNRVFPFIRYRTGDIATITYRQCPCGRSYPLLQKIIGRAQEFLVSKNNDKIPVTGMFQIIAESSQHVRECQLYQDTEGELVVFIAKDNGFTDIDEKSILQGFSKKVQDAFSIQLQYVDSIARTMQGKHRYVIQKLPIKDNY